MVIGGTREMVEAMNAASSRRGLYATTANPGQIPDLWFGHVRLPIQDLSHDADQPITRGDVTVLLGGEILNYGSLEPLVTSDTRVLASLLSSSLKLETTLRMLEGFWSIVVHDERDGTVSAIVDYLAKRPLYYRRLDDQVCLISSELDPLLVVEPADNWDRAHLAAVRKWGYCPDDTTPFDGISSIPPGCLLRIPVARSGIPGAPRIHRYDRLRPRPLSLRRSVEDAVASRMISDRPVSMLLSGGLDSTIIYQIARKHRPDLKVFHVDNGESEFLNDLDFTGSDVETIPLSAATIDEAVAAHQSPVDLGSVLPQLCLARSVAARGYHVALSGDGADELFGGYRRAMSYDSQGSDIFHELVHYHLPRLDRVMMSQTIELRCPFLERSVIETALTIPWSERRMKEVLRRTFSDLVPESILNRAKRPLKHPDLLEDRAQHQLRYFETFVRLYASRVKEAF